MRLSELAAFRAGARVVPKLQATMMTRNEADEYHPVHAY